MKKVTKNVITFILLLTLVVTCAASEATVVSAKTYSENGTWKCKISGKTWYFDVNDYTSEDEGDALGVVYIYKNKKSLNSGKYSAYGEYEKVSTNKYKLTYSNGTIVFKVSAKSIKVTQKKGKVSGTKLNGTFKLVRRHYS
jgi:hypothetical protein